MTGAAAPGGPSSKQLTGQGLARDGMTAMAQVGWVCGEPLEELVDAASRVQTGRAGALFRQPDESVPGVAPLGAT